MKETGCIGGTVLTKVSKVKQASWKKKRKISRLRETVFAKTRCLKLYLSGCLAHITIHLCLMTLRGTIVGKKLLIRF